MARLVVYDLLRRSDAGTAVIPVKFSPGLTGIARSTGLSKASVKRYLNIAESAGWVTRTRNPRAGDNDPTNYAVHVPPGLTQSLGAERAKAPGLTQSQPLGSERARPWLRESPNQTSTRPKPDQKKTSVPADPYSLPGFAEFWDTYPRKIAKADAAKAYRTALNRAGDPMVLIKAAAAYRDDPGRNEAYTKHPATWLNGDCWNDEPEQPRSSADRAYGQAQALKAQLRAHANGETP